MLETIIIFTIVSFICNIQCKDSDSDGDSDFGANLIDTLTNDRNIDLPVDEEYEDMRAELLAYHSALAKLAADTPSRRSLTNTPCWQLGGICVNHKLCTGFRFLTEVPGCKDKLNVCCFTWNRYRVRDMRDKGISGIAFPWRIQQNFGGNGIKILSPKRHKLHKNRNNEDNTKFNKTEQYAFIIRSFDK